LRELKLSLINPFSLVEDLIRNWWVILLSAIIGFSGFQVYNSAFVVEEYTSSTTIAVNLSGYTDSATATSLSRTIEIAEAFQNVLKSSALIDVVEEEIDSKITGTLNAAQKAETNLITLSVTDISPEKAYKTLKSVCENYHILTDSAFSNIVISVVTPPSMATRSNVMGVIIKSVFCGFIMAVLCIAIILVLSYFRDTVKNPSDVEALLDCKLFGKIDHINKNSAKLKDKVIGLMMNNPLIDYRFSNCFRAMAIKLLSVKRTKNIKSIMITSIAENEGKTTVSVNLALALAETGKKVILVDCDFKLPAVYKFFTNTPVEDSQELALYLKGDTTDYTSTVRYDKNTSLYLAGGKKQYRNSSEIINSRRFANYIKLLEEDFDFVIIDTPPGGITVDSEIASEKVDGLLLVVRQDFTEVEPINDYISNVSNDKLLGCVFNNVSTLNFAYKSDSDNEIYSQGGI
jgi:capsular exopolysaccharide synthesis family protein